ncbi:MAG: hypothetical protein RL468_2561 [Pseudomonadota bacterium]|jgi:hypothetical protein
MNRCYFPALSALAYLLALGALLMPLVASAQAGLRIPPIPAAAQAGTLQVLQPPEVLLNGQPARLSPGARIHGRDNLLLLSATLSGQQLLVRYTRDNTGLLHHVWVLNEAEARAASSQ